MAHPAYGMTITRAGTQLPEVTSITGPGQTRDAIDATHLLSAGACREFLAGLIDNGQVDLELSYLPGNTNQQPLTTDMAATAQADAVKQYVIGFTDTGTEEITFNAFPIAFSRTAPVEGKLGCTVSLKVTGEITQA